MEHHAATTTPGDGGPAASGPPGGPPDDRLRAMLESLPHLVFTSRPDGTVDYVNQRWLAFTGLSFADAIGAGWATVIHPDDVADTTRRWRDAVGADQIHHVEHRVRRADGAYRWCETRVEPIRERGRTTGYIGTVTDVHEQHELRSRIQAERDRFSDLTLSMPGVLSTVVMPADRPGTMIFHSGPLETLLGVPADLRDEALTAAVSARIPMEDLVRLGDELRQLASHEHRWRSQYRYAHPRLGTRWHEVHGTSRPATDGAFVWSCVTLDITERRAAERRLAMQHGVSSALASARTLDEAAPRLVRELCEVEGADAGALWLIDEAGGVLRCLTMHAGPALAGTPLLEDARTRTFAPGEGLVGEVWAHGRAVVADIATHPPGNFPRRAIAQAAGLRQLMAFPVISQDRIVGVVELATTSAFPADPQLEQACAAIGLQIGLFTERARAAAEVARSEARLQSVIESMSEGIVLATSTGKLLHWNPAALAIHGFTTSTEWERALPDFAHIFELATLDGVPLPLAQWPISRILGGEKLRGVELRVRRLDADWERIIAYGGAMVRQADGSELAVVTLADVTPRARTTEALQRLNATLEERVAERTAALEQANEELEAFTYSVSHDLRAPLRAVNGFADILLQDHEHELTPEAQRLARTIRSSGERMATLITDLLALSRYGRMALRRRPLDMAALAREALAECAPPEGLARYQITIADLPPAEGDPSFIKQIWINLLSNAIKYSRRRDMPRIEVTYEEDDAGTTYVVRDNGAGFPMSDAHRLFGLFQRLHAADQYEGTGVGLALVQRLVHRHGGRVWAESEPDQGATFRFLLPRRAA